MISAVDTNVLLDLLIPESSDGEKALRQLENASAQGRMVLNEVVYAELAAHFPSHSTLDAFLRETGLDLLPSTPEVLLTRDRHGEGIPSDEKVELPALDVGDYITYPVRIADLSFPLANTSSRTSWWEPCEPPSRPTPHARSRILSDLLPQAHINPLSNLFSPPLSCLTGDF